MENEFVQVIDNRNSHIKSDSGPITFPCNIGHNDPTNGAYGVAVDALYHGTNVFRFLKEYNVTWDDKIKMFVHYNNSLENAFWDGTSMQFGDGHFTMYPLVSQDITGHELGHALTEKHSKLYYSSQSGGINEAFSDILAETLEHWANGKNDWLIGREIMKYTETLRYMENPPEDGRSIKHVDSFGWWTDVHHSSGIFNHAFYQLVKVQNMPIFNAFECFLKANLLLWKSMTNFKDGACHVMQQCYDQGYDTIKVADAFKVVGIDLSDKCSVIAFDVKVHMFNVQDKIKVSNERRPVLKLMFTSGQHSGIATVTGTNENVKIDVCSEHYDCRTITKTATNSVELQMDVQSYVYVRLSSESQTELSVSLSWIHRFPVTPPFTPPPGNENHKAPNS